MCVSHPSSLRLYLIRLALVYRLKICKALFCILKPLCVQVCPDSDTNSVTPFTLRNMACVFHLFIFSSFILLLLVVVDHCCLICVLMMYTFVYFFFTLLCVCMFRIYLIISLSGLLSVYPVVVH